jgi:hypothetical protein
MAGTLSTLGTSATYSAAMAYGTMAAAAEAAVGQTAAASMKVSGTATAAGTTATSAAAAPGAKGDVAQAMVAQAAVAMAAAAVAVLTAAAAGRASSTPAMAGATATSAAAAGPGAREAAAHDGCAQHYPGLDFDDMNSSAAPGSLFCDFLTAVLPLAVCFVTSLCIIWRQLMCRVVCHWSDKRWLKHQDIARTTVMLPLWDL